MYFRRPQQRNCHNNCNQRPCQGQDSCGCNAPRCNTPRCNAPRCNAPRCNAPRCNAPRCNVPGCDAPGCDAPRCDVPRCDEPRCQPCYDEADYQVDVIHGLLEEYNRIERRADTHFNNALANLCDAIEGIEKGLECNKEGLEVWIKMECWLTRYYDRFGAYCDCIEKMQAIRECAKQLLILEWSSLETTRFAYAKLGESRELDKQLYVLKTVFQDQCIPKC